MRHAQPSDVIRDFADRVGEGDLDGALSLYEAGAVFLPSPVEPPITGYAGIRAALAPLVTMRPRMTGEIEKIVEADDTALVVNRWSLSGSQPGGAVIEMNGLSADVLRRGEDGAWRILIDDPWGGEAGSGR